jgi:methanogenic corrinoid protein MtbC1
VQICGDEVDPINLSLGERSYEIPFPFLVDKNARGELAIGAIWFEENKSESTLKIGARIQATVPKMLRVRITQDEEICGVMIKGMEGGDLDDDDKRIISAWLTRHGVKSPDLEIFLDNRGCLRFFGDGDETGFFE